MVKRNISFYERKKQRNYYKNMNFPQKGTFILRIFQMKKTLILWISESKKRSSSTQDIGTKMSP